MRVAHHALICDALERVFNGETKRLIINIPPRYSKTEIAVVNFIAWAMGRVPDCEFIHASYSATLAVNNSVQIRNLVQHEEYRAIFPDFALASESSHHWKTTAGGVMYATGTGGTITGFGAGKHREGFGGAIILDDLHKADEARSEVRRQNVIDWFQNTLESRKNSPDTPIVVIMQRLHENDIAGWLLDGGNGEEWEHLCLPAIEDDGTALWPEKHDIETLRRMEQAAPYVFAGQYLQRPAPPDGGTFKPDNLQFVKALPAGNIRWIRAWDLASTANDGDYTAGGRLGVPERTHDGWTPAIYLSSYDKHALRTVDNGLAFIASFETTSKATSILGKNCIGLWDNGYGEYADEFITVTEDDYTIWKQGYGIDIIDGVRQVVPEPSMLLPNEKVCCYMPGEEPEYYGEPVEIAEDEGKDYYAYVYNIEVEDTHTYFVGAAGIWVHNCGGAAGRECITRQLSLQHIQTLLPAAKQYWLDAGASSEVLDLAQFSVANLEGKVAAVTRGAQVVFDASGAGFGWFVDPTPHEHGEFKQGSTLGMDAPESSPAHGRLDLLTVLIHELGHVLGMSPQVNDDVMSLYLDAGERRLPGVADAFEAALLDTSAGKPYSRGLAYSAACSIPSSRVSTVSIMPTAASARPS